MLGLHSLQFYFLPFLPMSYVVASKVKDLLKGMGMMTAGDLTDALSIEVEGLVKKAAKRAKDHDLKTVGARHL